MVCITRCRKSLKTGSAVIDLHRDFELASKFESNIINSMMFSLKPRA